MNGSQVSENTWKQKLKSIHEASSDLTYGRNLLRNHITIRLSNLSLLAVIFWLNNIKLERMSVRHISISEEILFCQNRSINPCKPSEAISIRTRYFKRLRQVCTCERSSKPSFASLKCKCSFNRLKMERNSFKEYSVLAMVSKEDQRPMIFFHLDRVIAWLPVWPIDKNRYRKTVR